MADLNFLTKLSGWLQISIVVFGLLATSLVYVKWLVDKKITTLKDTTYSQKLAVLSPRKLSLEQKRTLITKLSPIKGHSVALASRLMDGESADFADEIALVFKEADLNVGSTNRSSLNDLPGFVTIAVTGDNLGNDADLISQALKFVGIDCRFEKISDNSISGLLSDTVYIIVGRKR